MSVASICRTHRITFESPTTVKDLAGGTTRENWTAVTNLTNLNCTIQNASHRERFLFAQRNILLTSIIYLPRIYTDQIERRFRIRDLATNRLFKIHSYADEAGRELLTKIYAEEYLK